MHFGGPCIAVGTRQALYTIHYKSRCGDLLKKDENVSSPVVSAEISLFFGVITVRPKRTKNYTTSEMTLELIAPAEDVPASHEIQPTLERGQIEVPTES
ncbi:hypothetical protein CEXT_393171 [Caerostris extrusa]|uniref:Uncharacterized protein n=1 Tax=Caerostris extrusa TaxID=172846 RepID=A0AAV4NC41_CAEEX|nr:hypothetical protein CEXT_393171 [Caerostris extrusa]